MHMKELLRANKGYVMFLLLFGVFRTAVADWSPIPSASMHPNLLEGDVVFINRLAYNVKLPLTDVVVARTGQPQRGDVVIFSSPRDGQRLIKRVIGLPGDVVELRDEKLIVNGRAAEYEPKGTGSELVGEAALVGTSLYDETMDGHRRRIQVMPQLEAARSFGPVTVPADQFLMLGDSRDNSVDSRYYGLVPRELLIGRAERILVSADIMGNWMPRTERFGMAMR
jgi:signal peptidase I